MPRRDALPGPGDGAFPYQGGHRDQVHHRAGTSMNAQVRTGGHAVLETLLAWGIRRVFTCPGSTEAAFLDATVDSPEFDVVLTPHESVAVSAADGYARATGEPAVAYLHTHVGLANALSHLYAARLARSPLVVLTGLKPAQIQAHRGFTSLP